MAMKNIELFDLMVPYLASVLYEAFPLCIDLNLYKLLENDEIKRAGVDDDKKLLILSEAMFWLEENRFLRFSAPTKRSDTDVAYPAFSCVRLTAKGVGILKETPSSIMSEPTIGDKISESVKKKIVEKVPELSITLIRKIGESLI